MMSKSARRFARNVRLAARSLSHEGTEFLRLWLRLRREVPGWLQATDARWLFACARDGPGAGVVVEIGSAWGKSTIVLARGSKSARRERVFTVDPHTGDDWFLAGCARPEAFDRLDPSQRPGAGAGFSSYGLFRKNLERFDVADWVVPIVSSSEVAAGIFPCDPIRLSYIDGLHTYEGVKQDIEAWIPRVVPGGIVIFDDYFNDGPGYGVRRAVDELPASGLIEGGLRRTDGRLVWTKRARAAVRS